jgi:hypothetical protein
MIYRSRVLTYQVKVPYIDTVIWNPQVTSDKSSSARVQLPLLARQNIQSCLCLLDRTFRVASAYKES